ncbi:hypothetical protein CDAR_452641 [Caerostris darwini]|uniref:Uncharacterized protein n=1 Tax=Caerostris darwini TaxID=1538125 RepID=A0AAV4SFZ7_9ARAC|nr:hypothetical protein CDAR_452641 [Caerostris darwini]
MSLCDNSLDLLSSYGVPVPEQGELFNISAIVNPVFNHWCAQKPVPKWSHYIVGTILSIVCGCSIIGNLLVIVIFTSQKSHGVMSGERIGHSVGKQWLVTFSLSKYSRERFCTELRICGRALSCIKVVASNHCLCCNSGMTKVSSIGRYFLLVTVHVMGSAVT